MKLGAKILNTQMKTKLLVLCYVLLVACSKEAKTPEGVLPKEKMVPLLIDIYIGEGKVNNMRISRDSSMAIFRVYEDSLFRKHQISDSIYRKSMTYYYSEPDQLEAIYETVLDSLNLREQQLKDIREKKEVNEIKETDKEEAKK